MRFVLALLLCMVIPFQGWAAVWSVQAPCPMAAAMAAQPSASDVETAAAQADCCNDAAGMAMTGEPCKTGLSCQASIGWLVAVASPVAQVLPSTAAPLRMQLPPPGGAPANVWRPPTLL